MNEEQNRAARAFVKSGAMDEVFSRVAEDLTAGWLATAKSDTDARERIWHEIQLIRDAKNHLTGFVLQKAKRGSNFTE